MSWCLGPFAHHPPGLMLVEAGLSEQLGPSHTYPSSAEIATNYRWLGSSQQITQGHQCLTFNCTKVPTNVLEQTHPVASFRQHQSKIQLASQEANTKGDLRPEPEANSILCGQHQHSSKYTIVWIDLHSQPTWGSTL